ncbi:hypothetical protein [Phyllobacterium sp. SB3]|uniref:hypothetical protein n=1 Tax=Phyllobacterium sp. SB3 TaxID=3156073 RepID=UPI0032AF564C
MPIMPPQVDRNHPERFAECQRAVEDSVINILGDAREAGWERNEILNAVIEVADNLGLVLNASVLLSVETELARLRKRNDV